LYVLEGVMEIVSANEAGSNLFRLVEQVNKDHLPKIITSRRGDAVLLSKEDWESLQETIYLQSTPGLVESIREAELADDWISEEGAIR
jgi:antitoxin YefM